MLTLRAETAEDIEKALPLLGRMPRRQRVDYLERASSKLLARRRAGHDVLDLHLRVQRVLAQEKQRLSRKMNRPTYTLVDKSIYDLEVGEATRPKTDRYRGLIVARDKDGWYATNGKESTKRYKWSGLITEEEILELL